MLRERGAVMGFRFGWERPLWFSRDGARDEYSMRRGNWHDAVGEECRAVRSAVGVLDQTSFAKYRVSGPGAEAFLDRLCANRLPAPGRIALTQMCRPGGGIECDVTVTPHRARALLPRLGCGDGAARLRLARVAPARTTARWSSGTTPSATACSRSPGPGRASCSSRSSEEDVSREAFPFFRARQLEVGGVPTLTLRVSYVGELGFELHHPVEHLRTLYDRLLEAGEPLGLVDFGYRALDSLRLEKAYRLWGVDMSADWTPLEAGLERFVAFDKGEFVGRDALLRQREEGVARTLACLTVETDDADPHGNEPVRADGTPIGYVSAGGYGHVVEQSIALAYLPVAHAEPGTRLTVDILGEPRPAVVVPQPIYDPENLQAALVTTAYEPVRWDLVPGHTALVVIDDQRDFLHPEGWYAKSGIDVSHMRRVIEPTQRLLAACRAARVPVIWTRHGTRGVEDGGPFMQLRPFLREGGLRRGTWGYEIHDDFEVAPDDWVVEKVRLSAFFNTNLEVVLRGVHAETVLIAGVLTNQCIAATSKDAMFRDFKPIVVEECTGTTLPHLHEPALEMIRVGWGEVRSLEETLADLERLRGEARRALPPGGLPGLRRVRAGGGASRLRARLARRRPDALAGPLRLHDARARGDGADRRRQRRHEPAHAPPGGDGERARDARRPAPGSRGARDRPRRQRGADARAQAGADGRAGRDRAAPARLDGG